mmetsp:Transcript_72867/g.236744  ORF Transcript_72867/g.236744 Transcript_72867/m.236744 type:complete len:292 (+) Transcript_72867:184-1059(+)
MRLDLDGGLGGGSGSGLPRPAQFRGQELVAELSSDPYLQSLVAAGPGGVEDGALAPKPMWPMEDWEPMGAREHRALYAALTKLGALRRSRSSSSSAASEVGATRDEEVGGSSSSAAGASPPEPETFLALSVFLEDFAQSCGPVARRVSRYQAESPEQWRLLLGQLEAVAAPEAEAATASEVAVGAGPGERRGRTRRSGRARRRISLQLFLDMMELWARSIGVPRDIRATSSLSGMELSDWHTIRRWPRLRMPPLLRCPAPRSRRSLRGRARSRGARTRCSSRARAPRGWAC